MYITAHVPLGAAIGVATGNPWLAAIFGLISHFAIDRIPHWQFLHTDKATAKSVIAVALDITLASVLGVWLLAQAPEALKDSLWVGALFASVPDIDIVLAALFPRIMKLGGFRAFRIWHDSIQCEPASKWYILPQIGVIAISLIVFAVFGRVS